MLEHLSGVTEGTPRILLREGEEGETGTRFVDSQACGHLAPKGRGNYEIHGEIARGGMGQIIKARDTDLGREVAIKVLDRELSRSPFALRRFIEEAQIGGQLQHPGVVPVYELGMMKDEQPYFAMKLVKGRTLSALLEQRKHPGEDRRRHLAIFESVCQTVAYAHSKGVIHRDLKPANIMVGSFGEVLVVDWGLAKVLGQGGIEDEKRAQHANPTVIETVRSGPGSAGSDSIVGSVMGTPAYMPPEQALGEVERMDERSDVFALGAILCEILTGQPPYVETEEERVVVQAAQGRLEAARVRIDSAPGDEELKRLCLECLTPAPAPRPRSAEEVARRVHEYLSRLEEKARVAEVEAAEARVRAAGERRARRLTLGLALAVVTALVSGTGAYLWLENQARERRSDLQASFEETQSRVLALQQEGRLEEALQVAEVGLASIEDADDASHAMLRQARQSVGNARDLIEGADERAALEERNAKLVRELEEIRLDQVVAWVDRQFTGFEQRFSQAFVDYGVDLREEDLVDELQVLRESGIASQIVAALDDWALMRRSSMSDPYEGEKLTMMAMDLDPEELPTRVREALLRLNRDELLALAGEKLGPELTWAVASALFQLQLSKEAWSMFIQGAIDYPQDFILNVSTGFVLRQQKYAERALPFLKTAVALRPENGFAQFQLGMCLFDLGHYLQALPPLRESELHRPSETALLASGWILWELGRLDECIAALESAGNFNPSNPETERDLVAVRYQKGEVRSSELLGVLEQVDQGLDAASSWANALFEGEDVEDDEIRRALEVLRRRHETNRRAGIEERGFDLYALCWARGHLLLGEPEVARDILDRAERGRISQNLATLCELDYLRAHTFLALGDEAKGRSYFDRGESRRERLMVLAEDQWQTSLVWKRRARAMRALGL